jgi:cytochrome c oxidase assembly factor CtaG
MPSSQVQLLAIVGSGLLIILILELIRRNYLKERYSLLWLTTGGIFLVLSLVTGLLTPTIQFFGFKIVSNALLLAGIVFLVIIALGMTVVISRLAEKNKRLTQEIVLLTKRVEDLEKGKTLQDVGDERG